jgi:TIR domain
LSSAFISYSRNDRDFVHRLVGDLENAGISVFFDQRVTPGASWAASISQAIEQAKFLLVVLSPDYVDSAWAQEEMKLGLEREVEKKAQVIPLMVRKCQPPPFIASKAYANFADSYEVGLNQLEAALAAHDPAAKPEYFVSYAWGDHTPEGRAREDIVDRLCDAAEKRGISILRDKKTLGLGGRISKFMERLVRGNRVFIVLSDKYLKSPYCMYELASVWRNSRQDDEEFLRRIRVFTLDDAKIWTPRDRALCAAYWRNESEELEAIVRKHGYDILAEKDFERYRFMKEFAHQIGNILTTVTDILQPSNFEELERYGFADPPDKVKS